MPAPTHLIVVCPIGKLAALELKWGIAIGLDAPSVFTTADPIPRTATHKPRSGSATSSQMAFAQAHLANPDPDLEGVIVAFWVRDQPSPYQQLLSDNGLTTEPNPL